MTFTVETKYALLEDGGRFRFDPAAEAVPTHVDGKKVTGFVTAPPVEVDVEDDASVSNWRKVRAAVAEALAAERPDVAEAAPAAPAPQPPAPHWGAG